MRILFAGSPAIALPSFTMIADGARYPGRWVLAGVLTNPDKRKGRGGLKLESRLSSKEEATDIGKEAARVAEQFTARGFPVPLILKPETLKTGAREAVAALKPDLLVSFAYGRIFGPRFMELFPLGGINVHPSLLPRYRGPSPIQEAILRRDAETGITVQRIAAEMDTGNILACEKIPLNGRETTASLSETAARLGAKVLQTVLEDFLTAFRAGGPVPGGLTQEGAATYCTLIDKDSGLINWEESAEEIDAQIRAYNPWPLARTNHRGQILIILEAAPYPGSPDGGASGLPAGSPGDVLGIDKKSGILVQTGKGVLAVSLLQYQTKKMLPWQAFLNGARDFIGSNLGGS
ncbi:methionyl-tRNA formyltransferase [Spirochaetia bacterium]|nr:methionyl-tRNA formyltransferase [Spirochaetia bacterium]